MNRRILLSLFLLIVFTASMHGVVSTRSSETGGLHYVHWDFFPIASRARGVDEFGFGWVVPEAAGTYVVEVGWGRPC